MDNKQNNKGINRRSFLRTTAAAGAGLIVSPMILGQTSSRAAAVAGGDTINVALLGAGSQGQILMTACLNLKNVRFKAVCDIWEKYNRQIVSRRLTAYKHEHNVYADYQEMLDEEKGNLDAVIIATPDFWHAPHTVACLEAGLNVYCEKEMSNTLEGAKKMVEAAKASGKLLQIGHQRRSNPYYIHTYEKLIKEANLFGKFTTINGQWNRSKSACEDIVIADEYHIDAATLEKYGFKDMQRFMNWRWYKGMGGGPIVDLGSHQIDVYSWFLGSNPKTVVASGSNDYWKERDWYDSVIAIYEYQTAQGPVRASYQTITTNSAQGYYEQFMGDEGTLVISESSARNMNYREGWVEETKWDKWVEKGYVQATKKAAAAATTTTTTTTTPAAAASSVTLDIRESVAPASYEFPKTVTLDAKPYHQPHLENFFDSIAGKAKLNCPAEIGYETAATVLKVNEAIEARKVLEFAEGEFTV